MNSPWDQNGEGMILARKRGRSRLGKALSFDVLA